jgi:hypothetical protein
MNSYEFLKQFADIENHLYLLDPAFDKKQGFSNFLKNLKANNLVSSEMLQSLSVLWQTRNKIVASASEESVEEIVSEKLKIVKQNLNI